jgi:hypothetical protein
MVVTRLQNNPAQTTEAVGLVQRQRAELQSRDAQLEAMQLKMNALQKRLREAEAVKRGPEASAAEQSGLGPIATPAAGAAVEPNNSRLSSSHVTAAAGGAPSRRLYGVKAYRADGPTLRKLEEPTPGGNAAGADSLRSANIK